MTNNHEPFPAPILLVMTSEKQSNAKPPVVTIYTDGGCEPNPGTGGWGAVLIYKDTVKELSGGALNTTNNRMEMTAAITALGHLKRRCRVDLYSDSNYLVKGMTAWLPNWKRKNWRSNSKQVLNIDLWQQLDALNQSHEVHWHWIRGHAGHAYNERCDALAAAEIKALRRRLPDS